MRPDHPAVARNWVVLLIHFAPQPGIVTVMTQPHPADRAVFSRLSQEFDALSRQMHRVSTELVELDRVITTAGTVPRAAPAAAPPPQPYAAPYWYPHWQ